MLLLAVVLNQEDRWHGDVSEEALALREYLRIENRPGHDWWSTCPLVLDKGS